MYKTIDLKSKTEANLNQRDSLIKVLAIIGLAGLSAIAIWQFYLFVTFKDTIGSIDLQGGHLHLWVAIGTAVMVCVGGFFLFSKVLRYDTRNEMHITSAGHRIDKAGFRKDVL